MSQESFGNCREGLLTGILARIYAGLKRVGIAIEEMGGDLGLGRSERQPNGIVLWRALFPRFLHFLKILLEVN